VKKPEELQEMGLERTAFLINRITWRGGMACGNHQAWYEKKRESWLLLGLGVVQELLARIEELEASLRQAEATPEGRERERERDAYRRGIRDAANALNDYRARAEDVLAEPLPGWPKRVIAIMRALKHCGHLWRRGFDD